MKHITKISSILGPALLLAVAAQAQVVVLPGRVGILPITPIIPIVNIPNAVPTVPVLPRPADVPVLPVPALPGVPMFRLEQRAVAVAAPAAYAAPTAHAARVDEKKAAPVKAGAPVRSIERARRGFGLNGKRPDSRGLQALFDGSNKASDLDDIIAIVEEIERPQTLPEADLLGEIGPVGPR
ncbi:MAG: hypothetical protein HY928_12515 [Elusimicrobia bacterium]|nr:hypothetical protein [Elusimicrobiota bacterium]